MDYQRGSLIEVLGRMINNFFEIDPKTMLIHLLVSPMMFQIDFFPFISMEILLCISHQVLFGSRSLIDQKVEATAAFWMK